MPGLVSETVVPVKSETMSLFWRARPVTVDVGGKEAGKIELWGVFERGDQQHALAALFHVDGEA